MKRGRKHQRSRFNGVSVKKSKNKTMQKGTGKFRKFVYGFFACLFVVLAACAGIGAGMYAAIVREIDEMNVHELALTRSSIVYYTDKDGNSHEAETLFSDGHSIWVEPNEIADVMKDAIVSIEDERFYRHGGVDIKRTAGAVLGYVREKLGGSRANYGGSTITQQVIKNITAERDRTATRKIKEMMRAVALEKQLSKDEILTVYLNVIYLANNCYGIEAASNMYFAKSASELNLTEAALIAGITQRPSYYDPIKNPENAKNKRDTVLAKMYELGKISEEEYTTAVASDLGISGSHLEIKSNIYSYFVDSVINEVINDLQTQKGYTETFAAQQIFSGGLKIYSTMDIDIQNAMEEVFEDTSNFPGGKAADAQASMMIIDHTNGQIKGIIGGKGKKTDSRGLNRATQTRRQPGSSIKPVSVYAPSLEEGLLTPSTTVKDEPIKIKDWEPQNSYSGFKGTITAQKAVEISANIPAIKFLQELGVQKSFDYAKNRFHLNIESSDMDLSPLALGGLTNGVTVKEMAAAYSVFANSGIYTTPHTYTKVLDSSNRVLLEKEIVQEQAIKESTAYVMSQMLYGVVNSSGGTGKLARLGTDMPVYGKTGTTNNDYDKWFVGYSPYYTGAVWYGFDEPASIRRSGVRETISARLWKQVMQKVHENLEPTEMIMPDSVVTAYVCKNSGLLATSKCSGVTEYFISGTEPKKYCSKSHSASTAPPAAASSTPDTAAQIEEPTENTETQQPQETETVLPDSTQQPEAPPPVQEQAPPAADDAITIE